MQIVHTHTHTQNMRQTNMHMWVLLCACVYSKFSPHRYTLSSQCKQTNVRHVVVVDADFFLLLLLRQLPNCLVRLRCHKQQRDTQKSSQKRIKNVTEREKEKRWQVRCSDCSWTELNSKSVAYLQAAAHSIFDLQSKSNASWMHVHLSPSLSLSLRMCAHTRRTSLRRKKTQAEARSVNCSCGLPREIPQPKATIPIGYMYSLFGSAGRRQHFKIMYMFKIFLSQGEKSYENFIAYPKGEKWEESIRWALLCYRLYIFDKFNIRMRYLIRYLLYLCKSIKVK